MFLIFCPTNIIPFKTDLYVLSLSFEYYITNQVVKQCDMKYDQTKSKQD